MKIDSFNFSLNGLSKSPTDAFQQTQFQHCPASLCLLMTPQYAQFELFWSTLSSTSSVSTLSFILASNEEAFEDE